MYSLKHQQNQYKTKQLSKATWLKSNARKDPKCISFLFHEINQVAQDKVGGNNIRKILFYHDNTKMTMVNIVANFAYLCPSRKKREFLFLLGFSQCFALFHQMWNIEVKNGKIVKIWTPKHEN